MILVYIPLLIASLMPWSPRPSDAEMIRGSAYVIYRDEQVIVGLKPTPCDIIRLDGDNVYSLIAPGTVCMQTLTYFEIHLDTYSRGQ